MRREGNHLEKTIKEDPNFGYMKPPIDSEDSEEEEEEQDKVEMMPIRKLTKNSVKKVQGRTSVSGETYDMNNKLNFVPKKVEKSKADRQLIKSLIEDIFMFSVLDEEALEVVLDAMSVKKAYSGEKIITEGEEGKSLYIVGYGKVKCTKVIKGVERNLRNYETGGLFGELALLYKAPRSASITATENCTLYKLDRETFNHVVKGGAMEKRIKFDQFLSKVPILSFLTEYERSMIVDCLKIKKFVKGEKIIREVLNNLS